MGQRRAHVAGCGRTYDQEDPTTGKVVARVRCPHKGELCHKCKHKRLRAKKRRKQRDPSPWM